MEFLVLGVEYMNEQKQAKTTIHNDDEYQVMTLNSGQVTPFTSL